MKNFPFDPIGFLKPDKLLSWDGIMSRGAYECFKEDMETASTPLINNLPLPTKSSPGNPFSEEAYNAEFERLQLEAERERRNRRRSRYHW